MEIISLVALIVGHLIIELLAILVLLLPIEYCNEDDYLFVTYFGFGFVYAKSDVLINEINTLRKTKNKRFFIAAPSLFNKHIYNFGVRK